MRPGERFELEVAAAYRAFGYQVVHNTRDGGRQSDLIARRVIEGAPMITLVIECKDKSRSIDPDEVTTFVNRVNVSRSSSTFSAGVMVSAKGFTLAAREVAAPHMDVILLSWEELESQVLDVRHVLSESIAAYEESEIFHDYQPLKFEGLSWEAFSSEAESATQEEVLERWMNPSGDSADGPGTLVVLADFGAGKTTLLEHLNYQLGRSHLASLDTRVPLYVPLRNYRETRDVTALLRVCFRDAYQREPTGELLWRRLRAGKFLVLLDGFDEMAERSDASRRLELFHELLDLLRTPSPTIITCRPGYFVGREELNDLLSALRARELDLKKGWPRRPGSSQTTDELRQKLVERNRRSEPGPHAYRRLGSSDLEVVSLLPLDPLQVKGFIHGRREELEQVGVSPEDVLTFLEKTYDLKDLASRPLLLKMVIETIVGEGLDPTDLGKRYGASGLYEAYTSSKLDLDKEEERSVQDLISVELRTKLAEAAAVAMYKDSTLETDFGELFESLRSGDWIGRELAATNLSAEEIATDLATCSFLTVDQGTCSFIHKSFRGFFVARKLKQHIDHDFGLLLEPLDREVLYFLGGFAPSEQGVAEKLWATFRHTKPSKRVLRRNLLVSYLFTKPQHEAREILDAEISDVGFKELSFKGTIGIRVEWRKCTVDKLCLWSVDWQEVRFLASHLIDVHVVDSKVGLLLQETDVDSLEIERGSTSIQIQRGTIDEFAIEDSPAELLLAEALLRKVCVSNSHLRLSAVASSRVESLELEDSRLHLRGAAVRDLRSVRSVTVYDGDQEMAANWGLKGSLLWLPQPASSRQFQVRGKTHSRASKDQDPRSIVLGRQTISPTLLAKCPYGFFGGIVGGGESGVPENPAGWGVLHGDSVLNGQEELTPDDPGCRLGHLLLVRSEWYEREVGEGALSSLVQLEDIGCAVTKEGSTAGVDARLGPLLAAVEKQFNNLAARSWPDFVPPKKGRTKRS